MLFLSSGSLAGHKGRGEGANWPLDAEKPRLTHVQDHAGERHAQHLDGALGDHHAALVAEEALDRQLLGEAHAAMDLHAAIGGPERALVAKDLHHEGLLAAVLAA